MDKDVLKRVVTSLISAALTCIVAACAHKPPHESDDVCSGLLELLPSQLPTVARSNETAELMAMAITDAIVVDEGTYQQMVRFIEGMKSLVPEVNSERFSSIAADYTRMYYAIFQDASDESRQRVNQQLSCVFDKLYAEQSLNAYSWNPELVQVDFGFRVNTFELKEALSEVVEGVEIDPTYLGGDGSHVCVAVPEDGMFYARATVGYGDCPSGCINKDKYYFSFDLQEDHVEYLGMYSNRDEPVGIAQDVLNSEYQCK